MNETLQETANRLKNFPGNVRGEVFKTHKEYIELKEGKEGVKKLEEKMKELGVPMNFDEMKFSDWVSEGMSSLTIIVSKNIFNWTDEEVFEMGRHAPRASFIIKIMFKYLVSIKSIFENAEKYWEKHYDFGGVEMVEYNEEERKVVAREIGFKTHPIVCIYHAGYFKGISEFAVKSGNVEVKQTASVHEGADYNEYVITW